MNILLIFVYLLSVLSSPPVWTFEAGQTTDFQHVTPMSMPRVGDTFWLHTTSDWAIGETSSLTVTLDPRVDWVQISGGGACDVADHVIVCRQPSYEWILVRVQDYGDTPALGFIAEYKEDQKVVTVALAQRTYLPIITRE